MRDLSSENKDLITYGATDEQLDGACRDIGKDEWEDSGIAEEPGSGDEYED